MIVWVNGPFGGGKTTTARLLHQKLPTSLITDPEEIGFLLRKGIGEHPARQKDFQEYPAWRTLVAGLCAGLDRQTQGGPVIAPMTLLRREYAEEIFDALANDGVEVHHHLLHARSDAIARRIEGSMEFPGDEERSEKVRAFRRRKLEVYEQAYAAWLGERAGVIDTTALTPDQVVAQALTLLNLP
ncbi:AAA family ATPase [Streptomyces sp. OspMP-M43]|uniref:AAA family ATPase n=1 Tax=Streptomyces sp. OspMP-M43 TaxID=1839781 RepID=UPI00081BBD15|nr:AAA family ATPase [Streptomyces sp. OspMP-M43]SCE53299.1 AAA domain-containing protein [Streptomyces sp. OspMP-M43]